MSNFMGVGIFWIGLNRADLGCWRLTLNDPDSFKGYLYLQDIINSVERANFPYLKIISFTTIYHL